MAFLDFIKNRGQAVSIPTNDQGGPGPETARQMYTREAAQEKANTPPVTSIPADQMAKVEAISAKLRPTDTPAPTSSPATPVAPTDAPTSATDNQQPMIQPGMAQDKGAPALSPTSAQMGAKEADISVRPAPTPSPTSSPSKPTRSMSPDF